MYKQATKIRRNHDDIKASQIDFARKQSKEKTVLRKADTNPVNPTQEQKIKQAQKPIDLLPDKYCECCGKLISKKGLSPSQYVGRRFCSRQCIGKATGLKKKTETGKTPVKKAPLTAEQSWEICKDILDCFDLPMKDEFKKIYELGFKHGSQSK